MLTVNDLSVNYGQVPVVKNIDFTLAEDEILMLVGPTGCGKTTILQAVAGLVPFQGGSIHLGQHKIDPDTQVPPEKRNVGMVFQDFALFPHLTVEQNIGFLLNDKTPVDHWLQLLGLESHRRAKPASLSGGQKQRVALARSLAHQPALMLLDEPLSNLDAALKDSLRWEIRKALKAAGVPAIWVTHDQEEALSVGDRVGILHQGNLEQLDLPETCYAQPKTRFAARFLGEASFLPGYLQDGIVRTALGNAPGTPVNGAQGEVDLLLRPDDLSLAPANGNANGTVEWERYEGDARLYAVTLDDGTTVKVRVSHETQVAAGEPVFLQVTTTHPLAAFDREG